MKHVSKMSLRRLPWIYLIYALFNDLVWIVLFLVLSYVQSAGVKAMAFFLTLVGCIALPIVSILCIYGLIDLSDYFRKSCYVYFLSMIFLMANMILGFVLKMPLGDTAQSMMPVMAEAREVLLDLRVPVDVLAEWFLLKGFAAALEKAKDQKNYRRCTVLGRIIAFLGIVYCVLVLLTEISSSFVDRGIWNGEGFEMAFSLLALVVTGIIVLSVIPVFLILRGAARQTYGFLAGREEAN